MAVDVLDYAAFTERASRIRAARRKAAAEAEEERIREAEAEHRYRKARAIALSHFRQKESMGVTEAEIMADGSDRVVDAKLERATAQALRWAAEERCAELDRNAAMLNREAQLAQAAGVSE